MRRLLAGLAVLLTVAAGCSSDGEVRVEATFDDVMDLVVGGYVMAGDVPVGRIEDISLTDDDRAHVVMSVQPDNGLPAQVEAVLKRTSLLGERYVELHPLSPGGQLSSGTIERTRVLGDIEDLVRTGNDLLLGVATDRLAQAVQAGAVAFGGRGSTLGAFLNRLEVFVGRYEDSTGEVVRLIDAADRLLGGMASAAETNAAALESLARSAAALQEEDDRLLDAVQDLRRLADVSATILAENGPELDALLRRLHLVLDQIMRVDGALQDVLTWLPRHNLHVPNGVLLEMSQVWNDFSFCGQDSEEDNPSNSCDPPNPGRTNHPPPAYQGPDACDSQHQGCPYPEGAEPYRPGEGTEADQ
ncbi:MAG: MCE family protein [Actinobacteria bacterium]|nr:MCE family protein [Actinomycetota bacterium]